MYIVTSCSDRWPVTAAICWVVAPASARRRVVASFLARLRCETWKKPVIYARVQTEMAADYPRGQWVTLIGPEEKGGFG